jgi:hypothetical protein
MKKSDWLCGYCWDCHKAVIFGTSSATPAIVHSAESHHLNSDDQIVEVARSVKEQLPQALVPQQLAVVSQLEVTRFKVALIN